MRDLNIELECRNVETSSSYSKSVTVTLTGVSDMGNNSKDAYTELLKRFIETEDVVSAFSVSDMVEAYGYDEVLVNVPTDDLMDWVMTNVPQDDILEWLGRDVMVAFAKQYIREEKIEGLI